MGLVWVGYWAEGPAGTAYGLQCERVRGEAPHYTVYLYVDGYPAFELVDQQEYCCTRRRAKAIARLHAEGVPGHEAGYGVRDLRAKGGAYPSHRPLKC